MENRSKLTVEVTLQPSDVYDPFLWSRRNLVRWVIVLFACFLAYDTRWYFLPAQWGLGTGSGLPVLLFLVALALFALFLLPWLRVRSLFRKFPAFRKVRRFEFSSEGMHLESEDGRGDYKWSLFSRIVETPKVFVFIQTTHGGTYLPKRCFSKPEDVLILRELIRQNFKGKSTLRRDR